MRWDWGVQLFFTFDLCILQDFNAINAGDGKAEAWLTSFTQQLRTQLPQGQFILTHARLYFLVICYKQSTDVIMLRQPSRPGSHLANSEVVHTSQLIRT